MAEYKVVKVPKDGAKITSGGKQAAERPGQSNYTVHRRRRHGPRYLARFGARVRCGGG